MLGSWCTLCEGATDGQDFIYRENPHAALEWAFAFNKSVYLVGWAMLRDGQAPPACFVEEIFKIMTAESRVQGLVWFIYDRPFVEGKLLGAANSAQLVKDVRALTL